MSDQAYAKAQAQQKTLTGSSPRSRLLQRTCACGVSPGIDGLCTECRNKRLTLQSSRGGFEAPSMSVAAQGNSPAEENVSSFNSAFDGASRSGHDFTQIPIYSRQTPGPQTKLKVNQPGDVYEQEADRVAGLVMRMTDPGPSVSDDEDEAKTSLMRKESSEPQADPGDLLSSAPRVVHTVLNSGGGQPLDGATRTFMEPRFGHDFSKVRVHTDERAVKSAQAVNALAYTVGSDVVFGQEQYAPETSEGRRLLAHELTHVVQQSSADGESVGQSNEKPGVPVLSTSISRLGAAIQRDTTKSVTKPSTKEKEKDEDPRESPRYIDALFQTVTYSWLNGASVFHWQENGKEQTIGIPFTDLEQDDTRTFVPIFEVHTSKDEALKTVKNWASAPSRFTYYSFYRTPDNIIMPTSFSINSAPKFHKLWPGLKQQLAKNAEDVRKGLQPLANAVNPIPGTRVDEHGNIHLSGNPLDWLGLLVHLPKLRRLSGTRGAGPIEPSPKPLSEPNIPKPKEPVIPPHEPAPQITPHKPELPESVWVQLEDGTVREYQPSQVKGDLAHGAEVATAEGKGKVVGRSEPPHSSQVSHQPPNESVWVQLDNGTVREYQPSQVKGDLAHGAEVATAEGKGKVVGRGQAPHSSQVSHPEPPVPVSSANTLSKAQLEFAEKVGLNAKSLTGKQILGNLDTLVTEYLAKFRQARVRSLFPRELLNKTLREALLDERSIVRKLLVDTEYAK